MMRDSFHIAAILTVVLCTVGCGSGSKTTERRTDSIAQAETEKRDSLTIELAGVDSTSVLDLLLLEHEVDYRSTAAGAFVVGIDGIRNSAEYFWLYLVNDSMPRIACDRYAVSRGDRVRWYFRRVGR